MTELKAIIYLNYKSGDTREMPVEQAFPNGLPGDNSELLHALEELFVIPPGELSRFAVTRNANGNVLVRPQAVFGL